ncbi:hypothetical protein NLI96_g10404 [Meripilus lineatus]|uniref:Uncharacterized protein n=1 Tax=Meripilus lineatus TaxID=2056292 RepID=A0AAD5UW29_9APHY|nr:hypothetical protein NLI96_g10404 [Physisporinus lineatus]
MPELRCTDQETKKRVSAARIIPLDSVTDCSGLKFLPVPSKNPSKEKLPLQLWKKLDKPIVANSVTLPLVPALFEVIGQISRRDCFLTTTGDREFCHFTPEERARRRISCCIEARPTVNSQIQWGRYHTALMKMVEHTGEAGVNRRPLFFINEGTLLPRIEVSVCPSLGHEIEETPMLDLEGNHTLPKALEDVPFDKPFRALFTVCYAPPPVCEWPNGFMYTIMEEIAPV